MDIHNEFIAFKKELVFYSGKPILNKAHVFYDVNDDPWNFASATGFTFKIWEERVGGRLLITWDSPNNITWSGNEMVLNAPSSDTGLEPGKYYYEIEYQIAGPYSVLIAFGDARFI